MFKSILAITSALTCCLGNPALASVGDAFDTATQRAEGSCYKTTGGHSVCWQSIKPRTYTVSLREIDNTPDFATTLYITCGGTWESYGPGKTPQLKALVSAFCEEQGH